MAGVGITGAEVAALAADARHVPGFQPDLPLVGVCPAGAVRGSGLAAVWTAKDLIRAWP